MIVIFYLFIFSDIWFLYSPEGSHHFWSLNPPGGGQVAFTRIVREKGGKAFGFPMVSSLIL